jgi:hypothetical protein
VDRAPGLSVRLKLTLSYAGFLMLAGALMLAAAWVIVLQYQPAVGTSPDGSGGLSMAKATRLVRPRTVTGDGEGLVSHAGLVWLGEVAARSGLTVGFSQVLASAPRRRHG